MMSFFDNFSSSGLKLLEGVVSKVSLLPYAVSGPSQSLPFLLLGTDGSAAVAVCGDATDGHGVTSYHVLSGPRPCKPQADVQAW